MLGGVHRRGRHGVAGAAEPLLERPRVSPAPPAHAGSARLLGQQSPRITSARLLQQLPRWPVRRRGKEPPLRKHGPGRLLMAWWCLLAVEGCAG